MDFFEHFDTLIFTNANRLPLSKSNGFGIYFYEQMRRMSTDNNLTAIDVRLMVFLIACLSRREFKNGDNSICLFRQKVYAREIMVSQPKIAASLKNLEANDYIRINRDYRQILIINPQVAYSDRFKNYTQTHNNLATLFNYKKLEVKAKSRAAYQDWSSDVPRQIEEKRLEKRLTQDRRKRRSDEFS